MDTPPIAETPEKPHALGRAWAAEVGIGVRRAQCGKPIGSVDFFGARRGKRALCHKAVVPERMGANGVVDQGKFFNERVSYDADYDPRFAPRFAEIATFIRAPHRLFLTALPIRLPGR